MRFSAAISVLLPWLTISSAAIVKRQSESADANGEYMCLWNRPQSALIRDTLYMEGGELQFRNDADLTYGEVTARGASRPVVYYLDLRQPFEMTKSFNASTVIGTIERTEQQKFTSLFGNMLSNDYSYATFGGALLYTDSVDESQYPASDAGVMFDVYPHDPVPLPPSDRKKFRPISMENKVTRYVMEGAYASAPSENLGWVFGGSKRSDDGDIRIETDFYANDTSALMIQADLLTMRKEEFKNIKTSVTPRAQAEIVWLPTSETGALVLIGGTSMNYEQRLNQSTYPTTQVEIWREEGQRFMEYVSIYDPENNEWYEQKTRGDVPPPTADFCSVVATSDKKDSHQIYIYGGYSGLTIANTAMVPADENSKAPEGSVFDTAYVLSVPSFVWTKVRQGEEPESGAGRRAHRCHKVADNYMLMVGGYSPKGPDGCLAEGVLRLFNLNSLEFESKYHPDNAKPYEIPASIQEKIRGETPVEFSDKGLETLLTTKYSKPVNNYWPFEALAEKNTEGSQDESGDDSENKGSGLPSYVPPLLGAILGLLVVVCILALVLYYLRRRRRTIKRLQSDSAASTVVKKRQTWSWLMNTKEGAEKGSIHEYDSTPNTEPGDLYDGSTAYGSPTVERTNPLVNEAPESQIYEMPASSVAQELPTARTTKSVTIDDHVQEIGAREPISPLSPRASVNKGSLKQ